MSTSGSRARASDRKAAATGAPPRSRFVRGSILGAAVAQASAQKLAVLAQQPFRSLSDREQAAQQLDDDLARLLFQTCGTLRGAALKLAQALATEQELVPEAYRTELARASYRAPPIHRALVQRILRGELGGLSLFHRFDLVPFAAASLGQVHEATDHAGQSLAVKIQYPGIAETITADFALLRTALGPTRFSRVLASCSGELLARLGEELDYQCEAGHTGWFRDHLALPRVLVPRVHPALTTRHVLTTDRLDGQHLDEWLAAGRSRMQRDSYGQLLVDLFHHCVFDLGRIHADPNPGNYLFRDDHQLALLDFGCVRAIEPGMAAAFQRLVAHPDPTPDTFVEMHSALGVHYRRDVPPGELREFLRDWGAWLTAPYREPTFDFGESHEHFARGATLGKAAHRFVDRYDGPFVYFARSHHGLLRLLQRLGARVRLRRAALRTMA